MANFDALPRIPATSPIPNGNTDGPPSRANPLYCASTADQSFRCPPPRLKSPQPSASAFTAKSMGPTKNKPNETLLSHVHPHAGNLHRPARRHPQRGRSHRPLPHHLVAPMTSPMDPIEILSQIYAAQGYIVVCFDQPVDIGFTWPFRPRRIPQPVLSRQSAQRSLHQRQLQILLPLRIRLIAA